MRGTSRNFTIKLHYKKRMSIWDILFCVRQNRKPVSVLTCHLSSRPTPRKRASNSFALADAPIYMVFLVLVPSPPYVAIQRRELLPRGFTLTLIGRSVFCYGLHKITPICDFHSRILYPVRTFLWCSHQRKMFTPSRLAAIAPRGMRSSRRSDRRPIVLSSSSKTRTRSRRLVPSWDTNNLCA